MLDAIKAYADDFQSVTLTQGSLTISVTFNANRPHEQPAVRAKQPQATVGKRPGLALLTETPPVFEFGE